MQAKVNKKSGGIYDCIFKLSDKEVSTIGYLKSSGLEIGSQEWDEFLNKGFDFKIVKVLSNGGLIQIGQESGFVCLTKLEKLFV